MSLLPLKDVPAGYGDTYEEILRLVKEKGKLMLFPARYNGRSIYLFNYENGQYILEGKEKTSEECIDFLKNLKYEYVLMEYIGDSKELKAFSGSFRNIVNVIVHSRTIDGKMVTEVSDAFIAYNEYDPKVYNKININDGTIRFKKGSCKIKNWNEIKRILESISKYMSFFEVLQFKFVITETGLKIWKVSPFLEVPDKYTFSNKTTNFISGMNSALENPSKQYSHKQNAQNAFNEKWSNIVKEQHRSGMRPYMASFWADELEADNKDPEVSKEIREWAHERGFFGYRVDEIGLSEDTYLNYVSDYDYFWVNRINNDYQIWIEDKLATRYILDNISEKLPNYYYCVSKVNGNERIIPLPDLPSGMQCTYNHILKLLRRTGKLAVKKTYGSHGDGFNVIEYKSFTYYLNGNRTNKNILIKELFNEEANYLITEYVNAHNWCKSFYPPTLNTVRVTVMQPTNEDPVIGGCFMRIGHSKGGFTDNLNTDSGGIVASIDKTNGRLLNPEFKRGNHYDSCTVHPDTGVDIEGNIPHWETIISSVKAICKSLPQLQFFGFDIAVTDDSFKIIEINVFPDYTKFLVLDENTQNFVKKAVISKHKKHYIDLPEKYRDEESDSSQQVTDNKYKYKFSVIMPVYNLEKYLSASVDSIIDQTLGFKENIQLILVDDGSKDSSADICKVYERRFPQNIKYVYKNNGGASSARNIGLNYIQGKYVTFFDGDDIWDKNAFAKVWDFITEHEDEVDVIACRRKWFEGKTGYVGNDFRFDAGTRIIDLDEEPHCFHVDVTASFMKSDIAKTFKYDETLTLGEDSLYVNLIILEKMKYGLVKDSVMYWRKRDTGESMTQTLNKGANVSIYTDTLLKYYEYLYNYSEKKFGTVIPYVQYLIMDAVRYRLAMPISSVIDKDIQENYKNRLIDLCKRTSLDVLLTLRNGSVGAKANLIRLTYPEMFERELTIDGKSVSINDNVIGTLNTETSLAISSCEKTDENIINIKGSILLPLFISKPDIFLSADDGETVFTKVVSEKSTEGNHMAVDGVPFYQRYNLSADIDISNTNLHKAQSLSFYISTHTVPVKLYAVQSNAQGNTSYIKNGKIKI